MVNDLSREELQQLMADVHARMEVSTHESPLALSANEYAAVMAALEIAGEM